ncbi:MAG: Fur family transcriptional regulator [Ktedonobacteraceae bacterium]
MDATLLHQHGYRLTPQRYLILHILEHSHDHLSITDLLQRVQEQNPQVTLSTVYRTLDVLKELGLVLETHQPGKPAMYEVFQGQAHHHLFCRGCQSVIHLEPTLLGMLNEHLEQHFHFHGIVLTLSATGYCKSCWQTLTTQEPSNDTSHF